MSGIGLTPNFQGVVNASMCFVAVSTQEPHCFSGGSFSAINGQASSKAVKQLPARLTKTTWYRKVDGYSGGYNDKSDFKGNTLRVHQTNGVNLNWKLSNIKQTSKNVYYAKMAYPGKKLMPVKIVIRNDKRFNIIPKRMHWVDKDFGGTEKFGAIIFTAKNKLQLVNSKNKVINVKAGVAPAAKWTFTKA